MKLNHLAIEQIEARFKNPVRINVICKSEKGWIHQMRTALGMNLKKLGEACGLSIPTIAQTESREMEGRVTLGTLRKIAEAMNCELTYAFVPKSDMKTFIEQKAYEKAKRVLSIADLHMSLENQRVSTELEHRIKKLAEKLIERGEVW